MLHGLIGFLVFALILLVVAWVIIYIIDMIPGIPAPAPMIIKLIIGIICLVALLDRGLPLLGMGSVL